MLKGVQDQIDRARSVPFREVFKPYVEAKDLPTLSDEEIALAFFVSKGRESEIEKIAEKLPRDAKSKFQEYQKMKTTRGPFFERFALFAKTPQDGILVGFGYDEVYYVLSAWNQEGADFWQPDHDLYDRPVI
jgi:hypothetical protein